MVSRTSASAWRNWNGNRNVPYLSRNAEERNLNLNWLDNRWNAHYRFAAVRKSLHFVFLSHAVNSPPRVCLSQPPVIRPISCKRSANAAYFFSSRALTSHAICTNTLRRSSLADARSR